MVDDEDRENEGDLIIAADYITPQMVNFMAMEARGLICLSLTAQQIERLNLPLMTKDEANRSRRTARRSPCQHRGGAGRVDRNFRGRSGLDHQSGSQPFGGNRKILSCLVTCFPYAPKMVEC